MGPFACDLVSRSKRRGRAHKSNRRDRRERSGEASDAKLGSTYSRGGESARALWRLRIEAAKSRVAREFSRPAKFQQSGRSPLCCRSNHALVRPTQLRAIRLASITREFG